MKMTARRMGLALWIVLAGTSPAAAQEVIPLWPGKAPGSEVWSMPEHATPKPNGGMHITDVTEPSLTAYLPERDKATGTAVLIAPGGGMVGLEVPGYTQGPAKWFNDRGIAAFVLKYRVLPVAWQVKRPVPTIASFRHGNANPFPADRHMSATIAMAIADARQALHLIRSNAARFGIDPAKVGMLGYSAGGGVSIGAVVAPTPGGARADATDRPDFVISAYGPSLVDVDVPANPPPLFLAVKQFHPNVARGLVAVFDEWTKAHAPAELHVYDQLGPSPFLDETGEWLERAFAWMKARGFVPAAGRRQP